MNRSVLFALPIFALLLANCSLPGDLLPSPDQPAPGQPPVSTPAPSPTPTTQVLEGSWTLVELRGMDVEFRQGMRLSFRGDRYSFHDGCNPTSGEFSYSPDTRALRFAPGIATRAFCPGEDIKIVGMHLFSTSSYDWEGKRLVLVNPSTRLVFQRQ